MLGFGTQLVNISVDNNHASEVDMIEFNSN